MDEKHTFSLDDEINLPSIDDLIDSSAANEAWTQLHGVVNHEDLFTNRITVFEQEIISPFHDHINNIPIDNLLDPLKQTFAGLSSIPRLEIVDFSPDLIAIPNNILLPLTNELLANISLITNHLFDTLFEISNQASLIATSCMNEIIGHINDGVQPLYTFLPALVGQLTTNLIDSMSINLTLDFSTLGQSLVKIVADIFRFPIPPLDLTRSPEIIAIKHALQRSGYSFTLSLWSLAFLAMLVRFDPKIQNALITKRMFSGTANSAFFERFKDLILSTPINKKRWPILDRALKAHQEKDFLASIHLLLPQVEGFLTEAYILRKKIIRKKNQIYAIHRGTIKTYVDGRGKIQKKKIRGLGELISQLPPFENGSDMQACIDFIMKHLVSERNAILHGNITHDGMMKRSTTLVLVIFLLAGGINSFTRQGHWNDIPIIR